MKPKKSLFSRNGQAAAFVTAVTFCVTGHSSAADYDWNAAAADFNTAANWSIGGSPAPGVPGVADTANVANGGDAQWTTNAAKTVQELRAGNTAAGAISISGGNTFTAGSVYAGRQSGAGVGTLTVSGANTIFSLTTGVTHVGTVSHSVGVTGAGATGVLNINSGAVYNHNPGGDESFIIGNNTPVVNTPVQAGTYKGTLNVDNATLNVLNGSRLYVAQSAGSVGEVNVTNNGIINVTNDWIVIGRGGQGTLNLSSGTITKSGTNNVAVGDSGGTGVATHTGGNLDISAGELFVGNGGASTGTYNLSGGAVINVANWVVIGRSGGNGTLNMTGGTINKTGGGNFAVPSGGGTGVVNHSAGALNVNGGEFFVANDGGSTGTYNLSGTGSILVNNWMAVGRNGANGTLNVTGGTITKTGSAANHFVIGTGNNTNEGKVDISGGLVDITLGEVRVGENSVGTAILRGSGELRASAIQVAENATVHKGTLKLDGGTLKTGRIYGGAGDSTAEFNGTTIHATANQTAFIDNLDIADIKGGGAIINSHEFNIGAPTQVLAGTGGVTKLGTGTLSLLGVNTYAGATTISEGRLVTATVSLANGPITVANSATLGVNVVGLDQSIQPSALTVGEAGVATNRGLDFNLGTFPDTSLPPLDVAGTLTLNGTAGTTSINVTTSNFNNLEQGSQIPLIGYDNTIAGTGGFASLKIGTLPLGMNGTLVNDTANKLIKLNITRLAIPIWVGGVSSIWNTSDANWINQIGGSSTQYANGDPVVFSDDSDSDFLDIQLPGTVTPGASVRFSNDTHNYTLSGGGKITGTTRLLKQNAGTVTLNTANNDFTGGVRIEGGSIIIGTLSNGGAASPIGAAPAAPANLVLAGGTLSYSGATATTNRGFTVGAANGGIEVSNAAANLTVSGSLATTAGGLVKKGGGTLTLTGSGAISTDAPARVEAGKLVINGTGTTPAQAVTTGELWVGNTPNAPATLEIISSTVTTGNWLAVGRGNGNSNHVSNLNISGGSIATVTNFSTGFDNGITDNLATQNITIANSTFNNSGPTQIAESRGSTTNFSVTGNSTLNTRELRVAMGGGAPAGASAATITLQDTSVWNVGTGANIAFASIGFSGGTGNLIVKNSAQFLNYDDFSLGEGGASTGTLTIQDSATVAVRTALLGRGGEATALITQTGGTFSNRGDNNFQIGVDGDTTFNLSGGSVNANGYTSVARYGPSTSSLNISGGTYTQIAGDRNAIIGEEGNGTLNVSGTGTLQANGMLHVGLAGSGVGTVNQTAGTINVGLNVIVGQAGKGTLNLSGGQLSMNTTGGRSFVVGNVGAGQGTVNISGTADVRLMNNASLSLGNENTAADANSIVNQTGGTVTFYSDNGTTVGGTGIVLLGREDATDQIAPAQGSHTYNLAGGTLTTGAVRRTSPDALGILKLNGGTLRAAGPSTTFVSNLTAVEVLDGGAIIDSNSHNVTITNALTQSGNGGLTKSGAGTLTLAGVNSYIGDTVVSAGEVTLADDAQLRFLPGANGVSNRITGTGTATLNGDFLIDANTANLTNGNSWNLVAAPVNETYGVSFSVKFSRGATVGNFTESGNVWTFVEGANTWTFTEATGVLTLTTGGVADPYTTWTSTYFPGVTDQNIIGRAADPDNDGSSNALEFALGGVPNNGANGPKVYNIQADGSVDGDTDKELLLTVAVRAATPAFAGSPSPTATKDGAIYTIQGSLDLTGFSTGVTAVNVVAPATAPDAPAGYEYRTFSLNGSNNLTGKGFLRVKVN